MKRPLLVSGIAIMCSSALFLNVGIKALPYLLACAVAVLIIYFIYCKRNIKAPLIPAICISVILAAVCFFSYNAVKLEPYVNLNGTAQSIAGKISTTPKVTEKYTTFTLKAQTIGNENRNTKIYISIPTEDAPTLALYDFVSIENTDITIDTVDGTKYTSTALSDNILLNGSAQSVSVLWECSKTPYYYCLRLKEVITQKISDYLDNDEAGLLKGMLFGGSSELSTDAVNSFRATGIAHLLAVSGLHTSLWCGIIQKLLIKAGIKTKARNIACIIFLLGFCTISAFTPSVVRASLMTGLALTGPIFKRKSDSLNSLGFAICLLVLANPYICASPSFLLSVSATAGVLFSQQAKAPIDNSLENIRNPHIKTAAGKLADNLCISLCAGIFTAPISAYFFRCASLVAPITNILTVPLAFTGLVTGLISTSIAFIPLQLAQGICILLFKLTGIILKIVLSITNFIGSFRFCSLPLDSEILTIPIIITAIAIFAGVFIKKRKGPTIPLKIISAICIVVNLTIILVPVTPLIPATVTIHNVGNGANVTVKQGLSYAHLSCGASQSNIDNTQLPHATSESLDFLYISNCTEENTSVFNYIAEHFNPKEIMVTDFAEEILSEKEISFSSPTVISDNYTYSLNNKISIETVDTYRMNCVIIKCDNDIIVISCNSSNDLSKIFEVYGIPKTLILADALPESLPQKVDTLVISNDSSAIKNNNFNALKNQCNTFYFTAQDGSITLKTGE